MEFFVIRAHDNDFTQPLSVACKALIEYIRLHSNEDTDLHTMLSLDEVREYLISAASGLCSINEGYLGKKFNSDKKTDEYGAYYYLNDHIEIHVGIDEVVGFIKSHAYKALFNDFFMDTDDSDSLYCYLETDISDFSLIKHLCTDDAESIIVRLDTSPYNISQLAII